MKNAVQKSVFEEKEVVRAKVGVKARSTVFSAVSGEIVLVVRSINKLTDANGDSLFFFPWRGTPWYPPPLPDQRPGLRAAKTKFF